jgi:hypothetical protein
VTAELSNDRGEKLPRHPWDWYVEEQWVTAALLDMIELEPDVDYLDPFCGMGNIPMTLLDRGFRAFGTDKFARIGHNSKFFLGEHDFMGDQRHMMEACPRLSIVMNPPFSYQDGQLVRGLSLRIARRALELATHKVAALVPLKWLSSKERYAFFTATKPSIFVFSERPSMPPGDQIEEMGEDAYKRGKVDYMWLVWDKQRPAGDFAPTRWIPPRGQGGKT